MIRRDDIWKQSDVSKDFLNKRRGGIPLAAEQAEIMLRLIKKARPTMDRFLDLGCGDGVMGRLILMEHSDASGVLLDFSEAMLDAARDKLGNNRRLAFVLKDYAEPDWVDAVAGYAPFDVIVSGYSIHHQPDENKQRIYRDVYDLLAPGGIFLNMEHVASPSPWLEELFNDVMIDSLTIQRRKSEPGIARAAIRDEFLNRPDRVSNLLTPVDVQLEWLRAIGFEQVDCYFKVLELALIGGIRPG
jgi:SAM-dependent methyltransferase